jgi:uncharacterized RDD family membrane protein YckC
MRLPAPAVEARRAGVVTRFLAFIVDALILGGALGGTVRLLDALAHVLRHFAPPIDLGTILVAVFPLAIAIYNVAFWCAIGQTPGKWLMGIRVVSLGGARVSIWRGVVRHVGYLVSALPCYLGFAWILGPARRGWHDHLARTEVVYVPRRPALERPEAPWVAGRPLRISRIM